MFCTKIDIANLEYKEPQSNRSGGKVVHVSTVSGSSEWKDRIRFQMSEDQSQNLQQAIWGLGTPLPGQDSSRRTLELSVESPVLEEFLKNLDQKNIKTAVEKSPIWFKKTVDESAVTNMYVPLLKAPTKEDSKATVRVKVKCGDYPTNIYVVDEISGGKLSYHKGGPDDLARNVKCMVMVETVGLWFMSRQYGMSLTATEIIVWPNKRATGIDAFTLSNDIQLQKVAEQNILMSDQEEKNENVEMDLA
tara:strand:- start:679 stop:1422 length:744 start_codon:yes stop_codon:yes gene_type:complete